MKEKRLQFLGVIFAVMMIFLAFAHMRICIMKGDEYSRSVAVQRTDAIVIKNRRGKFYDRNMVPLVENTVSEMSFPFCKGKILMPVRYGEKSSVCHLIGYTDAKGRGITGLEKVFDKYLKSKSADSVNVVKSANGAVIKNAGISYQSAETSGDSVVLTLDTNIQNICREALESYNIKGAAVVLDVKSFDVLAMVSTPGYNQNNISEYLKKDGSEFVNRCVASYNAGSIFKLVTLCSVVENGKLQYLYFCNGKDNISGTVFRCHKTDGHGVLSPLDATAKSCNCAFYRMGVSLGAENILKTASDFGFGNSLVCCSGFSETIGNLPSKKFYSVQDSVNYAIGQGEILLTPIQVANMVAIIANKGVSQKINVAQRIVSFDGNMVQFLRESGEKRVISPSTAEFAANAMRLAVTGGTASSLKDNPARIAGKTGTAETGWIEDGKTMVHGWFCGFFPYDNPKYAMAVLVENGGSGSKSAVPVFGKIAEQIVKIYPIG